MCEKDIQESYKKYTKKEMKRGREGGKKGWREEEGKERTERKKEGFRLLNRKRDIE